MVVMYGDCMVGLVRHGKVERSRMVGLVATLLNVVVMVGLVRR